MQIINPIPFAALGMGAAFTVLWGVADPVAAFAEVRTYTGVGVCTIGDIGTPDQAKNFAKEKALLNAREQAGVYLATYTRTSGTKLAANEISAITNNITSVVGEVKYSTTPGEVNGQPVTETKQVAEIKDQFSVGDELLFKIWRDGEIFEVSVALVDTNDVYG